MKRRDRLIRRYIEALGIVAVYVATDCGCVEVGMTDDPGGAASKLRARGAIFREAWWVADQDTAVALMNAAVLASPDDTLPTIAAGAGITLTADAVVQRRAAAVVADVEQRIADMGRAGQLRDFNDRYKAARAEAAKRGERFMPYRAYLEQYMLVVLSEVAEHSRRV